MSAHYFLKDVVSINVTNIIESDSQKLWQLIQHVKVKMTAYRNIGT